MQVYEQKRREQYNLLVAENVRLQFMLNNYQSNYNPEKIVKMMI